MLAFDLQGCYYPYGGKAVILPSTSCVYLVNEPGNFEWTPSGNGKVEIGAVTYNGVPAGRVYHNGVVRIGKVSIPEQRIFYSQGTREYSNPTYDVLVYKPNRIGV